MTPMKAIRAKCLDCCCGQHKEVRLCPIKDCPLWVYRLGRRPTAQSSLNEDITDKPFGFPLIQDVTPTDMAVIEKIPFELNQMSSF